MDHLEEVKIAVYQHFLETLKESTMFMEKLFDAKKSVSLDDVDKLIEIVGKYQAFLALLCEPLQKKLRGE